MAEISLQQLSAFIVRAKAQTYVGDGRPTLSHRPGSHDLEYREGDFAYLDSYYGSADFIGEEVVYFEGEAVWAMNYYGRLLQPEKLTAAEAGQVIKAALSALYREGRFLGGFRHEAHGSTYVDTNEGSVASFMGREWIERDNVVVYDLVYHGGLIR
ncbi:MAG: DUF5680 domain-containing protein [Anaerolineales bacterium]